MTVISIALLHVDRCNAKVATPSDTVNDKEFIRLPSCPAFTHPTRLIMPPTHRHRKKTPLVEHPAGGASWREP
jgi:hypothetical protein